MAGIVKTNELPVINDLTGATIIGLDKNGVDAQFNLDKIVRSEKPVAFPATNPAVDGQGNPVARFAGETWPVDTSSYGSTFTYFGNITVPVKEGELYVANARFVWNAGAWKLQRELVDQPALDPDNYYNKQQADSAFVSGALSVENLVADNLYDASQQVNDYYVNPQTQPTSPYPSSVANVASSPGSKISGLIPVTPGLYTIRGLQVLTTNSHWIRFQSDNTLGTSNTGKTGYFEVTPAMNGKDVTFEVPSGTTYLRFATKRGSSGVQMTPILQRGAKIVLPDGTGGRANGIKQSGSVLPFKAAFVDGSTRMLSTSDDPDALVTNAMLDAKGYAKTTKDLSPNVYNSAADIADKYINTTSDIITQTGSIVSGIITVEPNTPYVISNYFNIQDVNIRCLRTDGYKISPYIVIPTQTKTFTFTTPAECVSLQICVYKSGQVWDHSRIQVEKGTTVSSYRPYGDVKITGIEGLPQSNADQVTFNNADTFLITGCSYEAGYGTSIQSKNWISLLSRFTNFIIHNFAVSGQRTTDNTARFINNTANKFSSTGKGAADLNARFATVQNIGNETLNYLGGNSNLYKEEVKELVLALGTVGAFPVFATDWMIRNPDIGVMLKQLADEAGSVFHDVGTIGDRLWTIGTPSIRSYGTHKDTRGQLHEFVEFKYLLDRFFKPRKAIWVGRKISNFAASDIQSYNYDNMEERASIFAEIGTGHESLADANISYIDRVNTVPGGGAFPAAAVRTDEYISFKSGLAVSFTDVALFEFTIDKVRPQKLDIYFKMAQNINMVPYLKNNILNRAITSTQFRFVICTVTKAVYDAVNVVVNDTYTSSLVTDGTSPLSLTMKGKYYSPDTGWIIGLQTSVAATVRTLDIPGSLNLTSGTGTSIINFDRIDGNLSNHSFEFISTAGKPDGGLQSVANKAEYNATTGYYKVSLNSGDVRSFLRYDNLKLLINVPGETFDISDAYVEYFDGTRKVDPVVNYKPKLTLTEKIADNSFATGWDSVGKWTNADGVILSTMSSTHADYPTGFGVANHISLGFGANNKPQIIKRTIATSIKNGPRKVAVRVICRLFPKLLRPDLAESNEVTHDQLITKDSYDFGYLCCGIIGQNTGNSSSSPKTLNIQRHIVGIGWAMAYFEFDLPPLQNGFELQLFRDWHDITGQPNYLNHTFELQPVYVSCQVEGE